MKSRIMYIERKAGSITGEARIGRVKFSKTGRTMYYDGKEFVKIKSGFKDNCIETQQMTSTGSRVAKRTDQTPYINQNLHL